MMTCWFEGVFRTEYRRRRRELLIGPWGVATMVREAWRCCRGRRGRDQGGRSRETWETNLPAHREDHTFEACIAVNALFRFACLSIHARVS